MANAEKRIFAPKKELTAQDKENKKRDFINKLKKIANLKISEKDLIEVENDEKWSLLFCDGVHIYSLSRFKNGIKSLDNMYTLEERKALREFFALFTGIIVKKEVTQESVFEDEDESMYKMIYREEEKDVFSLVYKKKPIEENAQQ